MARSFLGLDAAAQGFHRAAVGLGLQAAALAYLLWVALGPLAGVWCFQLDGISTGATRTRDMRNMMIVSIGVFFVALLILGRAFGNHGLWMSLHLFLIVRGFSLLAMLPAKLRTAF